MDNMKTNVWMLVTRDKYELPLAVAGSCRELAKMLGVTENGIWTLMAHDKKRGRQCRYIKVRIEVDEENEDDNP